jgi:ATP-dependent RNA helicase SUPV3L1/SUV3
VTTPAVPDAPPGYYPRAGYRLAGERAIRIDMLERLADMIRNLDARSGFEATPEMLSITGLSLEQFAKLMQGMGYITTEATRPKRKPQVTASAGPATASEPGTPSPETPQPDAPEPEVPVPDQPDAPVPQPEEVPPPDGPVPEIPVPDQSDLPVPGPQEVPPGPDLAEIPFSEPQGVLPVGPVLTEPVGPVLPETGPGEAQDGAAHAGEQREAQEDGPQELEVYYLFTRASRRRPDRPARAERKPREDGRKPPRSEEKRHPGKSRQGDGGSRKPEPKREERPSPARAPRQDKPIDPDNPFAALMALKLRT